MNETALIQKVFPFWNWSLRRQQVFHSKKSSDVQELGLHFVLR